MPNFDDVQKPNSRSPLHGKKDAGHGSHEHGMGGKPPKDKLPFLATLVGPDGQSLAGATDVASVTYPSYFYVPSTPPVTDQDGTPQCVAYSNAYDQNQQDRPEIGAFRNFDEPAFFKSIGGTSDGAYMDRGLARRRDYGYPEQDSTPSPASHRIASFAQVELTADAFKAALKERGHGILMIGPWFHSWFHPFASGKLPAPDYQVGGHAVWYRGWNDSYGIRARNSWGTDWGLSGDFYLPYAFLSKMWAAYVSVDK